MTNKPKVGLALGSGAARGLAHVGVIDVLQENNIRIDYVAGTSVGAIVGAYYALNLDIKPLEEKLSKMTKKDYLKLIDLTNSKGLIKGDKVKKFLETIYDNKSFSDTKIPLKVLATDLLTGKEVVIDSGKLADGVRASISLPGIFTPVEKDGKVLVDGGLLNSTPVKTLKKMGAEVIIAVDLPLTKPKKDTSFTMIGALMQSYEIMRTNINPPEKDEDLLIITPDVSADGKMNGHEFYNTRFIEEGKKAAKESLSRIKILVEKED